MAKKGFFNGLVLGGIAAAAGYLYYKNLPTDEQDKLRSKVDDTVDKVRDRAVDYTYAATDAAANVRDRADEFVAQAQNDFGGKVADLKAQATEAAANLKDKASDLTGQLRDKVAPELADADFDDIVLDPTAPSLSDALADALDKAEEPDEVSAADGPAEVLSDEAPDAEEGLSQSKKTGLSEK
jgi:gas vesicle protein